MIVGAAVGAPGTGAIIAARSASSVPTTIRPRIGRLAP